jgi:hypothetical protein
LGFSKEDDMAKMKIPKKVAGYKVPRTIRKNALLKTLLASNAGRDVLAKALIAGAGAAAAIMVEEKDEISDAAKSGKRKGRRALGLLGRAFQQGSDAALDVVRETAMSAIPKRYRKAKRENPRKGVVVH